MLWILGILSLASAGGFTVSFDVGDIFLNSAEFSGKVDAETATIRGKDADGAATAAYATDPVCGDYTYTTTGFEANTIDFTSCLLLGTRPSSETAFPAVYMADTIGSCGSGPSTPCYELYTGALSDGPASAYARVRWQVDADEDFYVSVPDLHLAVRNEPTCSGGVCPTVSVYWFVQTALDDANTALTDADYSSSAEGPGGAATVIIPGTVVGTQVAAASTAYVTLALHIPGGTFADDYAGTNALQIFARTTPSATDATVGSVILTAGPVFSVASDGTTSLGTTTIAGGVTATGAAVAASLDVGSGSATISSGGAAQISSLDVGSGSATISSGGDAEISSLDVGGGKATVSSAGEVYAASQFFTGSTTASSSYADTSTTGTSGMYGQGFSIDTFTTLGAANTLFDDTVEYSIVTTEPSIGPNWYVQAAGGGCGVAGESLCWRLYGETTSFLSGGSIGVIFMKQSVTVPSGVSRIQTSPLVISSTSPCATACPKVVHSLMYVAAGSAVTFEGLENTLVATGPSTTSGPLTLPALRTAVESTVVQTIDIYTTWYTVITEDYDFPYYLQAYYDGYPIQIVSGGSHLTPSEVIAPNAYISGSVVGDTVTSRGAVVGNTVTSLGAVVGNTLSVSGLATLSGSIALPPKNVIPPATYPILFPGGAGSRRMMVFQSDVTGCTNTEFITGDLLYDKSLGGNDAVYDFKGERIFGDIVITPDDESTGGSWLNSKATASAGYPALFFRHEYDNGDDASGIVITETVSLPNGTTRIETPQLVRGRITDLALEDSIYVYIYAAGVDRQYPECTGATNGSFGDDAATTTPHFFPQNVDAIQSQLLNGNSVGSYSTLKLAIDVPCGETSCTTTTTTAAAWGIISGMPQYLYPQDSAGSQWGVTDQSIVLPETTVDLGVAMYINIDEANRDGGVFVLMRDRADTDQPKGFVAHTATPTLPQEITSAGARFSGPDILSTDIALSVGQTAVFSNIVALDTQSPSDRRIKLEDLSLLSLNQSYRVALVPYKTYTFVPGFCEMGGISCGSRIGRYAQDVQAVDAQCVSEIHGPFPCYTDEQGTVGRCDSILKLDKPRMWMHGGHALQDTMQTLASCLAESDFTAFRACMATNWYPLANGMF